MGRHSAPDEPDEDDRPDVDGAVRTERDYRPRRARPDLDGDETTRIEMVVDAEVDAPVPEAVTAPFQPVTPSRDDESDVDESDDTESDTEPDTDEPRFDHVFDAQYVFDAEAAASGRPTGRTPGPPTAGESDLDLIRGNSAIRARVVAAVLVPFVLYTAVLFGLGAMSGRTFLIWIWVPLVSAGVLAGLILDSAHRGRGAASEPADRPNGRPDYRG